jgi:hypothetical protein
MLERKANRDSNHHETPLRMVQHDSIGRKSTCPIFLSQPELDTADQSSPIHLPRRASGYRRDLLKHVQFGSLPSQNDKELYYGNLLDGIQFGSFPSKKDREAAGLEAQLADLPDTSESESSGDDSVHGSMGDDPGRMELISIKSKKSRTRPLDASSGARTYSWTTCPLPL